MLLHLEADTLDDLMRNALERVIAEGQPVLATKGNTVELIGCTLRLTRPRARLSRSSARGIAFSTLAELCWYLSGTNQVNQIAHYLPRYFDSAEADGHVHGAYGPRLFGSGDKNQIKEVIELLRRKPSTRRAVVQIYDREDARGDYRDVPCTCTMQFLVRDNRLTLITYMRSNDLFWGFPHDVFAFTMIQELVARSLNLELGDYVHMVGSLHLYDRNLSDAGRFLEEGWQPRQSVMPEMPAGDPWADVTHLLSIEQAIRNGTRADNRSAKPYWADLALLLEAFSAKNDATRLSAILGELSNAAYRPYVRERLDRLAPGTQG